MSRNGSLVARCVVVASLALASGCRDCAPGADDAPVASGSAPVARPRPPPPLASGTLGERFERYREHYADLGPAELEAELPPEPAEPLGASPARSPGTAGSAAPFFIEAARYFPQLVLALELAPVELERLRSQGLVAVDALPIESMGSLYQFIWTRDLPVLVTTDSVLHALHVSYELVMTDLERDVVAPALTELLLACRSELGRLAAATPPSDRDTWTAIRDVDLYVSVAGSLLEGAGAPDGEPGPELDPFAPPSELLPPPPPRRFLAPRWSGADEHRRLLDAIASGVPERPEASTALRGGHRPIDWGQFRVRGRYTETSAARRFFRALQWLGRPDTGFVVEAPAPGSGLEVDPRREQRAAGTLAVVLAASGALERWRPVESLLTELVGEYDDVAATELVAALGPGQGAVSAARDPALPERVGAAVAKLGRDRSRIRGQTVVHGAGPGAAPPPRVVAFVPQRFHLDAYLPTTVTFDAIQYGKERVPRMLATGLDVMAMLGNDEALRLLRPELERDHYAPNLRAARALVADFDRASGPHDLPSRWLGALRTLDDPWPAVSRVPRALRTRAYRRKMLQTELASWAQLRHALLLHGKQPSSAYLTCEYPRAYVEPWPATFDALASLAERAAERLGALGQGSLREHQREFFTTFGHLCRRLAGLARKELRGEPFEATETAFLENTIADVSFGSGPPRWDGWYPKLFYSPVVPPNALPNEDELAAAMVPVTQLRPTVADVMTDPSNGRVLEAAVGIPELLVVVIEDEPGSDAATLYVGPIFSYHELTRASEERMTDEEWEQWLRGASRRARAAPPRPPFVRDFQAPARQLSDELRRPRPQWWRGADR